MKETWAIKHRKSGQIMLNTIADTAVNAWDKHFTFAGINFSGTSKISSTSKAGRQATETGHYEVVEVVVVEKSKKNLYEQALLKEIANAKIKLPLKPSPSTIVKALIEHHANKWLSHEFYLLGGQLDQIVGKHVLKETKPVYWDSITQHWLSD